MLYIGLDVLEKYTTIQARDEAGFLVNDTRSYIVYK